MIPKLVSAFLLFLRDWVPNLIPGLPAAFGTASGWAIAGLNFIWRRVPAVLRGVWRAVGGIFRTGCRILTWVSKQIGTVLLPAPVAIRVLSGFALIWGVFYVDRGLAQFLDDPVQALAGFAILCIILGFLTFEVSVTRLLLVTLLAALCLIRLFWTDPSFSILSPAADMSSVQRYWFLVWFAIAASATLLALIFNFRSSPARLNLYCLSFAIGTLGLTFSMLPMPGGIAQWRNWINAFTLGFMFFGGITAYRQRQSSDGPEEFAAIASNVFMLAFLGVVLVLFLNREKALLNDLEMLKQAGGTLFSRAALIAMTTALALKIPIEFVQQLYRMPDWASARHYIMVVMMRALPPVVEIHNGVLNLQTEPNRPVHRTGGPAKVKFKGEGQDPESGITKDEEKSGGAILEQAGFINRVMGPEDGNLKLFERIRYTVDSRPQKRRQPVHAVTRDGLPVCSSVELVFRIRSRGPKKTVQRPSPAKMTFLERVKHGIAPRLDQARQAVASRLERVLQRFAPRLANVFRRNPAAKPEEPARLAEPYRFLESAARRAARSVVVARLPDRYREYIWTDQLRVAAEKSLQDILSDRFLAEVIEPMPCGSDIAYPLPRIQSDLENALRPIARDVGAELLRVTVNRIDIDPDLGEELRTQLVRELDRVRDQWIANWAAKWQERERVVEGTQRADQVALQQRNIVRGEAELMRIFADALNGQTAAPGTAQFVARYRAAAILDELGRYLTENPSPAAEQTLRIWRTLIA